MVWWSAVQCFKNMARLMCAMGDVVAAGSDVCDAEFVFGVCCWSEPWGRSSERIPES